MPIHVRTPDGKIAVFPDGMPEAQIEAVLRREYPVTPQQQQNGQLYNQSRAATKKDFLGQLGGAVNTFTGSIPFLNEGGAALGAAGDALGDAVAGRHGPNDGFAADFNQRRAIQAGSIDQFKADHPILASTAHGLGYGAQMVGALATGGASEAPVAVNALRGGLVAGAKRFGARTARNAITGAGLAAVNGAAQPGTLQQRVASAAQAVPAGAALGAALPAAVEVGGAGLRGLTGAGNPAVNALTAEGVPLTPGQRMGGAFKATEEKATSLPIVGDAIAGARKRGFDALNRAVANRALGPIGETLPANIATGNDAVAHVSAQLGAAYKRAEGMITKVDPTDPEFLKAIEDRAGGLSDLPQATQDQFKQIVQNRVIGPLTNGSASGAQIGDIQSQLASLASDYSRAGGPEASLGRALDGVGDDVVSLAAKQNPDYAAAKGAADTGWANFVRMRTAAGYQGAKGGVFTPAQLKMAVRSNDDSVGKGATARGDALLYDLANNSDQVMGSNYPDSGSAGRIILNSMALGTLHPVTAGVGAPAVATLGAAAVPYALMGRGVANAFASADPAAAGAAAPAVNSLTANFATKALPRSITSLAPGLIAQDAQNQGDPAYQ